MQYNYLENVKEDVKTAILDNCTKEGNKNAFKSLEARDELYEKLYDNLWVNDSVTGNASDPFNNGYNAMYANRYIKEADQLLKRMCMAKGIDPKEIL